MPSPHLWHILTKGEDHVAYFAWIWSHLSHVFINIMSPPSLSKMPYYIEIYYGHSNMVWTNSSFCVGTYICHHVALFGAQSITRCV